MSKAAAPARRDGLRDYAAQFGDPMPEFDPLYQALITPAVRAAMTSLPRQLDYDKLMEIGFGLRFFCVVNDGQPDIFCTRYGNSNVVILNLNLINHLYNLARQLFCMRDVLSTIGAAAGERRPRTTYNRYNDIFDIKLNIYETDTDCPYQPVSPNKQPRCEIRQDGFLILFWFMLEHLILHELSHIVQGHLAVGEADPWRGLGDSGERRIINRSTMFEILADTLSVHWFAIADIARIRRSYGGNLDALTPAQRRALRLVAPALSYWVFSSYSLEFCMDVRKHKMAIIGHAPEPETAYLQRNYRIGFTEELALRALTLGDLSVRLSAAAVTTARAWQREFRDRIQFYSPSSLYNKIIHQLICTEFLESKDSIEALVQQTRPLNFLGEHWQRTQYNILIDWIAHSDGEGAHRG